MCHTNNETVVLCCFLVYTTPCLAEHRNHRGSAMANEVSGRLTTGAVLCRRRSMWALHWWAKAMMARKATWRSKGWKDQSLLRFVLYKQFSFCRSDFNGFPRSSSKSESDAWEVMNVIHCDTATYCNNISHILHFNKFQHMSNYCGWKKSCTTLDGWNPKNHGINNLSTGAGFLPSTVGPAWAKKSAENRVGDLSMDGLNEMMDFMDAFTLSSNAQEGGPRWSQGMLKLMLINVKMPISSKF